MIILRSIIAVIVLITFLVYVSFLLVATNPCQRIDRATLPVKYAANFAKQMAKPWSSPETLVSIDKLSLEYRFRFAIFFRIQFYSDSVPPVRCDWDQHKYTVLGSDSSLIKKEEAKESQRMSNLKGDSND